MNKIFFLTAILTLVLLNVNVFAQQSVQKLLSQLPPLPDNICNEKEQAIIKWCEKLSAIKDEMETLQNDEKLRLEKAKANAKPRIDMFEQANVEKIQKIGEDVATVEESINVIITEITSFRIKKRGDIEVKYLAIFEPLYMQLKDAQSQSKSTVAIDKKIRDVKFQECKDKYEVQKQYLKYYYQRLNELIQLGLKGNGLSDEMMRTMYVGYTFRTQYGLWLSLLIDYTGELSNIYNDIPVYGSELYNK